VTLCPGRGQATWNRADVIVFGGTPAFLTGTLENEGCLRCLPNLPPVMSSNGTVIDRGSVTSDERLALLAYFR
jgi:hypothetical protein